MSLRTESALGLLAQWASVRSIMTVSFGDRSLGVNGTMQLIEAVSDKLRFALRPGDLAKEVVEAFSIRLDGSETWDNAADPLGLDCSFESGAFLWLRLPPDMRDLDLEPETTLEN